MTTDRIPVFMLDPNGGTPGQGLVVAADGATISFGDAISGGSGDTDRGIVYNGTVDPDVYAGQDDAAIQLDLSTVSHVSSDEATHPSVLHFPDKWNGWRYWMAFTPYIAGNDATEDPCLAVSQDGITWQTPAGVTNPLDDAPGGTRYNSDTELAISPDGLTLNLIWRQRNDAATGAEEIIYLRTSTNGATWTAKQAILTANKTAEVMASPAVLHDGTQWVMWTVDVLAAPNVIKRRTAASLTGTWSAPTSCTTTGLPSGRDLWHLSVLKLGGQYVALLNDCVLGVNGTGGRLYLMTSTNGLAWALGPEIVSPNLAGKYDSLYRGTLVPTFDNGRLEFRMWHGAWMSGTTPVWGIYHRRLYPSPPTATASSLTVQDENGTVATGVTQIDFQGANVTAAAGTGEVVVTVTGSTSSTTTTGAGELLMQDGVTAPPVPLENEARSDWLYQG